VRAVICCTLYLTMLGCSYVPTFQARPEWKCTYARPTGSHIKTDYCYEVQSDAEKRCLLKRQQCSGL
jgi:hypothetical protein